MSDENNKEVKGLKKKEKLLIVAVIVVAVVVMISGTVINAFIPAGKVIITVGNKEYETVSLKENKRIVIENEYGENIIIIKDEQVFMERADCPNKTCVKKGKITKTGQSIVCLPHRLTVTISD
ncbi:MAG: NusG domain II-containing protein [Lachnospiraceae bacterium]|nr:NusG domain II-containing protein [Lachnospiraceae bacterium]